jgi:peptidoglycan/xylan/chitin deacetylase (PgdA/CDA1 family)
MPSATDRIIFPSTRMDQEWYSYSAFPSRRPIHWPGGARIALWIVPAIEFMEVIPPEDFPRMYSAIPGQPDVRNSSHRDYGNRVGIWRIMEVLDKYGLRATAGVNSSVLGLYPEIVEESLKRGWEIMAHGDYATRVITGRMPVDQEREFIRSSREAIRSATGKPPAGWLGPSISESPNTPGLLAEAGFTYTADWCNDDQPFRFEVPTGKLLAVPYSFDVNDFEIIVEQKHTAWEFEQAGCDQFDALYEDARAGDTGLVMCIALQPFCIGQPFRIKYLDQMLAHIMAHGGVWPATGSEIAEYYEANY